MLLKKPPSIEADEFKSAKWDEVTRGRDFRESDALTLEVLMEWYSVVRQCIEDSVSRTRGDDPRHAPGFPRGMTCCPNRS